MLIKWKYLSVSGLSCVCIIDGKINIQQVEVIEFGRYATMAVSYRIEVKFSLFCTISRDNYYKSEKEWEKCVPPMSVPLGYFCRGKSRKKEGAGKNIPFIFQVSISKWKYNKNKSNKNTHLFRNSREGIFCLNKYIYHCFKKYVFFNADFIFLDYFADLNFAL